MRVLVGVASILAAAQPARAQQHAAVDEPANRAPPRNIPCSLAWTRSLPASRRLPE